MASVECSHSSASVGNMAPPIAISKKHKRFCHEYIKDLNATQAALRTGYAKSGANVTAHHIMQRPEVKEYLKSIIAPIEEEMKATSERTLRELSRLAFHDPGDYFKRDKKGNLVIKDIDELTKEQRAAIAEYDPVKKTLKLYSKDPSLDKLGKHFKLFTELNEQQTSFTIMPELKLNGQTIIFNVGEPVRKK